MASELNPKSMGEQETIRKRKRSMQRILSEGMNTSSFKKRQQTMMKKAYELSTLCEVDVCIICYGSDGSLCTWPEDKTKVRDIAMRFKRLDEKQKARKRLDLACFHEKIQQDATKKNRIAGSKFPTWDEKLDGYSKEKLMDLDNFLVSKLQSLQEQLELLKKKEEKEIRPVEPCNEIVLCQSSLPAINYKPDCSEIVALTNSDQAGNYFSNLLEPSNSDFASWPCNDFPGQNSSSNSDDTLIPGENNGFDYRGSNRNSSISSINNFVPMENMVSPTGFMIPMSYNASNFFQSSISQTGYQYLPVHGMGRPWPYNFNCLVNTMGSRRGGNSNIASMENNAEPYMSFGMLHSYDNGVYQRVNDSFPMDIPPLMTSNSLHQGIPTSSWWQNQQSSSFFPFH